jgi:hypothetical protein
LKLQKVKKISDLKLDGVTFQAEYRDTNLHSVTLTDVSGKTVTFTKDNYSDFSAYVPAPPDKENKWELSYEINLIGLRKELFDEQYQANSRRSELESEYSSQLQNIKIEQVDIEVKE